MKRLFILCLIFYVNIAYSKTIIVENSTPINNLSQAVKTAIAGDTILFRAGVYPGGEYISNLKGTNNKKIYIIAENNDVLIKGGNTAWQISDPENLLIKGFRFEGQSANGVNIDDAGTYNTPATYIDIIDCKFGKINASGNNDLLKLSGIDNLKIENCEFYDASAGGSMIDMVGCHNVEIYDNSFVNAGSNAIQAKGGTKDVIIQRNYFNKCGQRAINIGGSTGLEFFRPLNANYESANIYVYSNIFIGSIAPIAYVGTINSEVINNTIINPEKWVIRILQENTNEGFAKCSNNSFINNVVYHGNNAANPSVNIGGNTMPETFIFSNNVWYNHEDTYWAGPNLPTSDKNFIYADPLFNDYLNKDFSLKANSPAIGKGYNVSAPDSDFNKRKFKNPPSSGAFEYYDDSGIIDSDENLKYYFDFENSQLHLFFDDYCQTRYIDIVSINGDYIYNRHLITEKNVVIELKNTTPNQPVFAIIKDCKKNIALKLINVR